MHPGLRGAAGAGILGAKVIGCFCFGGRVASMDKNINDGCAPELCEQPSVLFMSRRNSLRSVVAQACLAHVGRGRCRSYSCGVPHQVAQCVDPVAIAVLRQAGIPPPTLVPQDWRRLLASGVRPKVVILLDPLEDVDLPLWPEQPDTALWRYPDLAAAGADLPVSDVTRLLHSMRRRLEILATLLTRASEGTGLRSDIRDMAFFES